MDYTDADADADADDCEVPSDPEDDETHVETHTHLNVQQAPLPAQQQAYAPGEWTTGLFDCFDDTDNCCLTYWCPCVTFGRIAHITDRGLTSSGGSATLWCLLCFCFGSQWKNSYTYRRSLRMKYNLPEEPCGDCFVHFFCERCSLCQMYRELRNRGFDMSLGYRENMERRDQVKMQPPQAKKAMIR